MKQRKHVFFAAGVLVLVLMFGAAIATLVGQDMTWAAPSGQQTEIITAKAVTAEQAEIAGLLPTQEILSQIYDQVAPSVVSVQVTLNAEAASAEGQSIPGLPFPFPFGTPDQGEEGQTPVLPQGQGSGFIYDNDGHIVTNNHVVEGAETITVYFYNGMWADAEVVATDPSSDLAVLKVTPPDGMQWQPLVPGSDDALRAGYYVVAMGSPFGLDETMTLGVVSALDRSMPTGDLSTGSSYSLPDVIQTDTAINPGNSGGPLLNLKGEVVGVNFAINSPVRANAGVGFAIPVSVINKVVPALIENGKYTYSYLGISGQTIDATVAAEKGLEDNTLGVYVGEVVSGGPAETAGVQAGDIVVAMDDEPVIRFEDLVSHLFKATTPNQTATLTVLRDGETVTLDVTVAERPAPKPAELATGEGRESGIAIAEAIKVAKQAVTDSELMQDIESATATRDTQDGKDVWIVTLTGDGRTATVVVDVANGDVVELNVE